MVSLSTRIDFELLKRARLACDAHGVSIQDVVGEGMKLFLAKLAESN